MNFRICISLFLLCCLLQPSTAQKPVTKPKEVTVKAMTYNTYSGRKQGIDKIAEVIKKENPDIVSLQEIERNTEINPWDTPKKLSELTGMKYYYFAHALDIPTGGDYGNVILSKYPVSEEKSFKLSVLKEGDYVRSFGYVKVVKEGKEFYFATTHLDHKYEDAARLKQVDEILRMSGWVKHYQQRQQVKLKAPLVQKLAEGVAGKGRRRKKRTVLKKSHVH